MNAAPRAAKSIPLWTAVYAAYAVVMLRLEQRMRSTGGPGIIPFELAGTSAAADAILQQWGAKGRHAARSSLLLDFGYMLTYGYLTALLLDGTARRNRHPRSVSGVVAAAVVGDAIEGVALLRVLKNHDVEQNASLARSAALTKFTLLGICTAYLLGYGFKRAKS
jgi:hypothetical protein